MEMKVMSLIRQGLQLVGLVVIVFMLLNGVSEFWARHAMSAELVGLTQSRYAWTTDEDSKPKRR